MRVEVSREAFGAVLVVALLVLAGCNTITDQSDPAPERPPTVTPAPVPSDAPTPTPGLGIVPGLSGAGVNGSTLYRAHLDALADRSFTVESASTVSFANGSTVNTTRTIARVAGARMLVRYEYSHGSSPFGEDVRAVELWGSRRRSLSATIYDNGSVTAGRLYQYLGRPRAFASNALTPIGALTTARSRVTSRVRRNGTLLFRVVGTTGGGASGTDEATVRALVDSSGRVHRANITSRAPETANVSRRTTIVRYTAVDSTILDRPAWYDTALRPSTESRDDGPGS